MLASKEAKSFEAISNHTAEIINQAAEAESPILVEAPPSSGKTKNALQLAARGDLPPVTYYTGRTDLYEQAKAWAEEHGIESMVVPSPYRDCPTFRGETNQSAETIKQLYKKGQSAYSLHMSSPGEAYTPCMDPECPYMRKLEIIENRIDDVDLLIGNHFHARREKYNDDRLVILDEFNPDPFLTPFPSEDSTIVDEPGQIIKEFLSAAVDTEFPSNSFRDVTDILEYRGDSSKTQAVFDWFDTHGVDRASVESYEFMSASAEPYDATHLRAPLLVLSLFCMEKVGPGYELAPAPSGTFDQYWRDSGLTLQIKCLRNRNTGEMHLLRPPDLSNAVQVIGLDGIPTPRLWNLLFAHDESFERKAVIKRENYTEFLESAMSMNLVQIGGNAMHHYSGAETSDFDRYRFATVRLRENQPTALISTKNALRQYRDEELLEKYVARREIRDSEKDSNRLYPEFKARHYGTIRSSNEFAGESLGMVTGTPHPGDAVIKRWSALCGYVGESKGEGIEKEFEGFTQEIYEHFVHNQVVQAILRFGRDGKVRDTEGSTVYVSTQALPEWLDPNETIEMRKHTQEGSIIAAAARRYFEESEYHHTTFTVQTINDEVDVSRGHVRDTLEQLIDEAVLEVKRNHAKGGADLYEWADRERIQSLEHSEELVLLGDKNIYLYIR